MVSKFPLRNRQTFGIISIGYSIELPAIYWPAWSGPLISGVRTMNSDKDNKLIETLYRETYERLFIYAISALGDRALAEEAVQDTFRIACMKTDILAKSQNHIGWLINTLKNVIRNIRKTHARLNRTVSAALAANGVSEDSSMEAVEIEIFCTAVLGMEDYALIKRIAIDKCTMLEASEELGISVEACKKRVQRAKNKLKKSITENL